MELIPDGKRNLSSLAAGTPEGHQHYNPDSPISTHVFSGADFQPTWQLQSPPGPLLSESGGLLLYLSDAFSLVIPKSFLTFCHFPSMQQLHTSSPSAHFKTWVQVVMLRWAILGLCQGLMLWLHDIGLISPHLVFSALAEIITLHVGELNLLFHLLHSLRPSQRGYTIHELWPLLLSLENKLLGIRGTYNLVWVWKGIEWKADTQTSLSNSECH